MTTVHDIRSALCNVSFSRLSVEADVQAALDTLFEEAGLAFKREHALAPECRPDFWFPADDGRGLALEVKVGGGTAGILRQLHRYAELPSVSSIVLVTSLLRLRCPIEMCGKPVAKVLLTRSSLW